MLKVSYCDASTVAPYCCETTVPKGPFMQRTAKVFMKDGSQAIRLPKEVYFSTSEVFIRKQGDDVILSAPPKGLVCLSELGSRGRKGIHGRN